MQTIVFTDGASKGNPGKGGWGSVVVTDDRVTELGGKEDNTTNNRMELHAAIEALKFIKNQYANRVIVYSDSKYVIQGITTWVYGWQKNGWKTKAGERVLNEDLWQELLSVSQSLSIQWEYAAGHIAIAGNERADAIASGLALGEQVDLYKGPLSGYGIDVLNISHNETHLAAKSAARKHASAKAYSYVSKVDGAIEIHKTWAQCEARVRGRKARYKKALSRDDERKIIEEYSK